MLYDFETCLQVVDPNALRRMPIYKKLVRVNKDVTIKAIFRKLKKFLDAQEPSARSQLVWVRLAKMMGRSGTAPHADICYIEDVVEKTVGDGKEFLMLCGVLFMISIAEREETWLTNKNACGEMIVDRMTGKLITWRGYWIDENFVARDVA